MACAPIHEGHEAGGSALVHAAAWLDVDREAVGLERGRHEVQSVLAGALESGEGQAPDALGEERRRGDRHEAAPSFCR